jgi:hypothetical protein
MRSRAIPIIVHRRSDEKDRQPACSAAEALTRQECYLNSTLANHALALLARLFRHGRICYHGGFVNLATGQVSALAVNPMVWTRMGRAAEKERRQLK